MKCMLYFLMSCLLPLASGCSTSSRATGFSGLHYLWCNMIGDDSGIKEKFGPFTLADNVELSRLDWNTAGEFLPLSADGYDVVLRGFVRGDKESWVQDVVFPESGSKLKQLLGQSEAVVEVKIIISGENVIVRRFKLSDAIKARSLQARKVYNQYPLLHISTETLDPAVPIKVVFQVCKPDALMCEYHGHIALRVEGVVVL